MIVSQVWACLRKARAPDLAEGRTWSSPEKKRRQYTDRDSPRLMVAENSHICPTCLGETIGVGMSKRHHRVHK